jgi:hypothetical protein
VNEPIWIDHAKSVARVKDHVDQVFAPVAFAEPVWQDQLRFEAYGRKHFESPTSVFRQHKNVKVFGMPDNGRVDL